MSPTSEPASIKVFFALWPSASESRRLAAWQPPLQQVCGGRAMRRKTMHNTLVFVGHVEPSRLEALRRAAQQVNGKGFQLCFDAARYWEHNRIVYAAPASIPQDLLQLVEDLQQSLEAEGFRFEQREYTPHVTLLRNASQPGTRGTVDPAAGHAESAQPLPAMQTACWRVKDFVLVQSLQEDGQASYPVLARFPLAAG